MAQNITDRIDPGVVELLVAIGILLVFTIPALELEGPLGQFPRVFLFVGIFFLTIELLSRFLPEPYQSIYVQFTSGLTEDMSSEMEEDVKEKTGAGTDEEQTAGPSDELVNFGLMLGVLVGFFVISYLIGFLFAIPLLALAVIYLFGTWNPWVWIVVTVFLMVMVWGLFGEIMNVPITEGRLL